MSRAFIVGVVMVASLSAASVAHAQCPPSVCAPPDLLAPELATDHESMRAAYSALGGGIGVAVAAYLTGVLVAADQPHHVLAVDGIPIVGPFASAARNANREPAASLLSFVGSAQAMSLLVIAAAATDLWEQKQVTIRVAAGINGCGMAVTWRFR
jgi:hypothetical protein